MALVPAVPLYPEVADPYTPIPAGSSTNLRALLHAALDHVEDKAELSVAFLEKLAIQIGPGAVSGGTISAGTGLSVNIAAGEAFVPTWVKWDATVTVGGIAASQTAPPNNIYLRQDGTFQSRTNAQGVPNTADGHGLYLLWGTATTDGSGVTAVSNTRDSFAANILANVADGSISLDKLDDDGATSTQVIAWNGTTWAPADADTPGLHASTHATGEADELTPADIGARAITDPIAWSEITDAPDSLSPTNHASRHHTSGVDPIAPEDIGAAPLVHDHDSDYYTQTAIDTALAGKSNTGHTHTWGSITSKPGGCSVVLGDGVNVITVGTYVDVVIPYMFTISEVTTLADVSGSIVVDIWVDTYANAPPTNADSITSASPPTLSSAQKAQDSTLTGWTTTVTQGHVMRFQVESVTSIKQVTIALRGTLS